MRSRRHRKIIWGVPFAYGALLTFSSAFWIATGRPFDVDTWSTVVGQPWSAFATSLGPAQARFVTAAFRELAGHQGLLAGLMVMTVAATAYRAGQGWAWMIMWAVPLHAFLELATVASYGALETGPAAWNLGLVLATVAAQLASRPLG